VSWPTASRRANRGLEIQEVIAAMQTHAAVPQAAAHEPKSCTSCSAPILWAQVLDENGERIWNQEKGRYRSMPVDWNPSAKGTVIVYWRESQGFVCRTLKAGEQARLGEKPRTSHFVTCPQANSHRNGRRRR
jgi:hypothetical protein